MLNFFVFVFVCFHLCYCFSFFLYPDVPFLPVQLVPYSTKEMQHTRDLQNMQHRFNIVYRQSPGKGEYVFSTKEGST